MGNFSTIPAEKRKQHHENDISTLHSSEPFPHLEEHAPPFEAILSRTQHPIVQVPSLILHLKSFRH